MKKDREPWTLLKAFAVCWNWPRVIFFREVGWSGEDVGKHHADLVVGQGEAADLDPPVNDGEVVLDDLPEQLAQAQGLRPLTAQQGNLLGIDPGPRE